MTYMLIFKAYLGDRLEFEEWHYFSKLEDLYVYAAWRLTFAGTKNSYDRYDVQVKPIEVANTPIAA